MIYTFPFIAAAIGWITNYIAVKMLFHPKKEITVLFLKIQGIFPKRQRFLAERLGAIVAQELISIDEITNSLHNEEGNEEIKILIEDKIDFFLRNKLKKAMPMLAMFIGEDKMAKIKITLLEEINNMLPTVVETYTNKVKNSLDIEKIVTDKVANFSSEKLESILYAIMQKEFRFIEIVGAVLGFVIGVAQVVLLKVLQ